MMFKFKGSLAKSSATLILLVATVLTASHALAQDKVYRWRLAETWGPNFPIFGDATKNMAEAVRIMSNGRLDIRIDSVSYTHLTLPTKA